MRVHIIGGPGSGKTTLARRFAEQFHLPFYVLDVIGWENGVGPERPLEVRLQDVHEIAKQPSWVTEGAHMGWIDELLHEADVIIFLDLAWYVARWRIIQRHMRASLAGTNRHKGLLKLYRFLGHAKNYYKSAQPEDSYTRLVIKDRYLLPYTGKVVHCQHPTDVERCFDEIIRRAEKAESALLRELEN